MKRINGSVFFEHMICISVITILDYEKLILIIYQLLIIFEASQMKFVHVFCGKIHIIYFGSSQLHFSLQHST